VAGLPIPRWAEPFRGGPIHPEAGLPMQVVDVEHHGFTTVSASADALVLRYFGGTQVTHSHQPGSG